MALYFKRELFEITELRDGAVYKTRRLVRVWVESGTPDEQVKKYICSVHPVIPGLKEDMIIVANTMETHHGDEPQDGLPVLRRKRRGT